MVSEFVKTMRDWRRMCEAYECPHCPLMLSRVCGRTPADMTDEDICKGEAAIMEWAAEHTEPVYPMWVEWLEEMGLTRRSVTAARAANTVEPDSMQGIPFIMTLSLKAYRPIPADIAEKLGLKPKGGNGDD